MTDSYYSLTARLYLDRMRHILTGRGHLVREPEIDSLSADQRRDLEQARIQDRITDPVLIARRERARQTIQALMEQMLPPKDKDSTP